MIHMKIGLSALCESILACIKFVRQGIESHFSSLGLATISAMRESRSPLIAIAANKVSIIAILR